MNANCVPFQQSPLGSIDFLALSLHIVSVISTPIHIIAIFCILKRSSESLESLKWSLLNYHSMVIFFSYSVNFFESPYILLPAMAGTSIGFLDQFSVDCQEQIYFLVLSLALLIIVTPLPFERRFYELFGGRSKLWQKLRIFWIMMHYSSVLAIMTIVISEVPEQEKAVLAVFKRIPCLPEFFQNAPFFVLSIEISTIIIAFTVLVLVVISEVFFFTMIILLLCSEQVQNHQLSSGAFRARNMILFKLHAQIIIPLPTLAIPLAYAMFSIIMDYYSQAFNNLLIICASLHGLISSAVLVIMHEDYRKVLPCFRQNMSSVEEIQENSVCPVVAEFHRRTSTVVIN
ncbi:Serpentine Receptor, class H [Caenorhabditis elegans]|uniref:Serpentine Receptor, class H n=1 Tax=Caenorhabditis elegans TaxID=6239 RepID=O16472_CAEEL|nr:Serpentine Receptor, class H [Caenorhabditis elegans]CCD67804.1 Serpentine Receptor, class H [Caenorhabditis elegans]|eukprot:NP_503836.1 Serpentine Receptor, class H [Caenorhabditis elegans]